jgi:type IV pilus assembly protein PilM
MGAMSQTIENLAREISLCFKYYAVTFRGEKPSEVVFAGGNLYEAALMESLRQQLNMEIRVAEPLRGFDLSRVSFDRRPNPQMCEWAVAVGLALKGWEVTGLQQPESTECVSKV